MTKCADNGGRRGPSHPPAGIPSLSLKYLGQHVDFTGIDSQAPEPSVPNRSLPPLSFSVQEGLGRGHWSRAAGGQGCQWPGIESLARGDVEML